MPFLKEVSGFLPKITDYIVYGAIALVTLIGCIKCLFPLWGVAHCLRRAVRTIRDSRRIAVNPQIWNDDYFLGHKLAGAWARFLHNASRLDSNSIPCNVSDYINDDTVTHGPGNAQLADMIPSLLTSLGILGTFVGMMRGLGAIDFSDSANIIAGIPTLLSSMQFAFGTSVAGVSCSIIFNIVNKIAQGSSYKATDDFVNVFTKDIIHYDQTDNDVVMIIQNAQRDQILQQMADTLPNQVANAVHFSVSQVMQPVASSMDNFLVGATRGQIDGVARIVNNFISRMNDSLNDQFLQLGKTMTEMNEQQRISNDQLAASLDSTCKMLEEASNVQHLSQDILGHFEQFVSELSDARVRDNGFNAQASELLQKMRSTSEQQQLALSKIQLSQAELSSSMNSFAEKTSVLSSKMADSVKSAAQQNATSSAAVSEGLQSAASALSKQYGTFLDNASEMLTQCINDFSSSMASLTERLSAVIEKEKLDAGDIASLQHLLASIKNSVERTSGEEGDK